VKLPTARHPSEDLCKYLRAKVSTAPHGDKGALWAVRESGTAVYWCLLTMGAAGPDDGLVHADGCGSGRRCAVVDEVVG
jgi:hypothetical protein